MKYQEQFDGSTLRTYLFKMMGVIKCRLEPLYYRSYGIYTVLTSGFLIDFDF